MKRKDFYQIVLPLSEKLYRFAYALIPDDLQAEQLVIDSLNAFLLKERKTIMRKSIEVAQKKDTQIYRRLLFKNILRYLCDIGIRRAVQLREQMKVKPTGEFAAFYNLEPKVRFTMSLRYEAGFSVEEIEEIVQLPRYEVIEKIHNGRFLLLNDLNAGTTL